MINREELVFSLNDLDIAAVRWRPSSGQIAQRILCIHGWLDNAGSFEALGSRLAAKGFEVLALDLAGCGRTSHRSLHGYYNLWDDLIDIEAVIEHVEWQEFAMIGHSRGAGVTALYASTQPQGLRSFMLIDGVVPPPYEPESLPQQLRAFIEERKIALAKNARQKEASTPKGRVRSFEEAWQKRSLQCKLSQEDMQPILERALIPAEIEGLMQWSHDQRLNSRSIYRLTHSDKVAMLSALKVPGLLLIADQGRVQSIDEIAMRELLAHAPELTVKTHSGDHHFHMESKNVDSVCQIFVEWTTETDTSDQPVLNG